MNIPTPRGTIRIPDATLVQVAAHAAAAVEGARPRRQRRIEVDADSGRVRLELVAQRGRALHELAADVQEAVAAALRTMCGLSVASVDVTVEELE